MPGRFAFKPATIALSGTVSGAADIDDHQIIGVIVPTGWTAANLTFQIDPGDGTFHAVTGLTLTTPTANEITFLNTGAAAPYVIPILVGARAKVVSSTAQLVAAKTVLLLLQKLP